MTTELNERIRLPALGFTGVSDGSARISDLVLISPVPYSRLQMQNQTETLGLGSKAPEFSLRAANREGDFALSGFLDQGYLILEFLRGTW